MNDHWLLTPAICLFLMLACTPTQQTQTTAPVAAEESIPEVASPTTPVQFLGLDMDGSPKTIAFLGGTLISRMDKYGILETALTARWPDQPLRFRNLGWPADDVFGTARSEFGSAHNTKSWKPPDPEEGYGFEVIQEHIGMTNPDVVILGYGSEAAFVQSPEEYQLFVEGYIQLINELEKRVSKLVLLSPTSQWAKPGIKEDIARRNQQLKQATLMIQDLAKEKGHLFIDLFHQLSAPHPEFPISENGIHLTEEGYRLMAKTILTDLDIYQDKVPVLKLSQEGTVLESQHAEVGAFDSTSRGFRFDLSPTHLSSRAEIYVPGDHLLKIDGHIQRDRSPHPMVNSQPDSMQMEALREMIVEKNRLHRFRINPLNKVYTHLFRQHEMGHLAYETDDYRRLTEEKDELIVRLKRPQSRRYEVVFLDDWKSPRDYPDHEVPSSIPNPNPEKELAAFTVSEGMKLNLFAADPMIANPISITWDNQGRAWVGTSSTYPQIKPGLEPVDRVVILEDTDKDGVADKSTVFAEGILIPHSVMPVKGGAYVSNTTELMFLADYDGDDKADDSRVIYSGFGHGDVHHTIHSMRWAPWGDLYFSQSININSFIETPYGFRKMNGSGFWAFRPETERLEIFSIGMINPWGQAFDDWGQCIVTDGAGSEGPTYIFPGSAHLTAVGAERILHGMLTGKPKNTAAEFITGTHLPDIWKGSIMSNDFRANRTVRYQITEQGSGYAAEEVETVLHSSHRSFRPVDNKIGPDGAMYIVDWYSPIIDHGEVDFYHPSRDKSHGRIWRLTATDRDLSPSISFKDASDSELLDLLASPLQFNRIHANRELVERNCSDKSIIQWLSKLDVNDPHFDHHRLEALWLGVALNRPHEALLRRILESRDHRARAAAIRMIPRTMDALAGEVILKKWINDPHPQVRLETVNALRILQTPQAVPIALQALDQEIDDNLDYMLWLTVRELEEQWLPALSEGETLFGGNVDHLSFALKAANNTEATQSLANLVKEGKISGQAEEQALLTIANLGGSEELQMVLDIAKDRSDPVLLRALVQAPPSNTAVPSNVKALEELIQYPNKEIRTLTAQLYSRWNIPVDTKILVKQASNTNAGIEERLAAAEVLTDQKAFDELADLARHDNTAIRSTAIAAWAKADARTAAIHASQLLTETSSLSNAQIIFGAFCSLQDGHIALRTHLSDKKIKPEIAEKGIRIAQSSGRDLSSLVKVLSKAGGLTAVGVSLSAEQRGQILASIPNGNRNNGRQIYQRKTLLCATCHEINGQGGKVGPDLSSLGAYMTPGSILESLISPNTDIKQGYETVVVTKKDGKVISGTLDRKTETGALVRDAAGNIQTIANEEIQDMKISSISMMPPGLTASLRQDELVDLMRYLTTLGK